MTSSKIAVNNGFLLINKKKGETSFQSLFPLKKKYGKKLGHTGTLDKFAEGLLVILVGKATKFVSLLSDLDKVYEAEFSFGKETDTLDPEGNVVFEAPTPEKKDVLSNLSHFLGSQDQVPPNYSALHVNGKRAYERVLAGEELNLQPRKINIYSIDYISGEMPNLKFRIHCSKGTYIRSLARDLGIFCGSRANVSELRRLSVGPFNLTDKFLEQGDDFGSLKTMNELVKILKIPTLKIQDTADFQSGKSLDRILNNQSVPIGSVGIISSSGDFLGMIEHIENSLTYRFVI